LFFFLAFCAAFGYALQITLLASFYRKMDTLSAVAYRGLSLSVSMLPLLAWAPLEHHANFWAVWPLLLLIFVLTAGGNWAMANTVRYLPVAVATALGNSLIAIVAGLIGFFFFHETLLFRQVVVMGLILTTVFSLGLVRSTGSLPKEYNVQLGLLHAGLAGVLLGSGFCLVGVLSRSLHPFLVGYVWEVGTGVAALLIIMVRLPWQKSGLTPISVKEFVKLLLASSPTLVGTGLYALSMSMGPIGIATAIISTQMVFTTILSRFFYQEKLTQLQWGLLLGICGLVMVLKLVS
jgi:drug/metabolite transporter (DMT)-like permease